MNEILKLFFSLSVSGSIVALIIFALKPLLKDRLSKTWQYYIWLIVIMRMIVPYSVQTNIVGHLFYRIDNYLTAQNKVLEPFSSTYDIGDSNPELPQIVYTEDTQNKETTYYWDEIKNNLWLFWLGIAVMLLVRKVTNSAISKQADMK
ncbi:M56 family metallopeptidase [Brassicibacter mesophilus]|uniref:M56 family metallopeptidase n=1 Tax=Brassicibacter mesophilus TaxID=745119 RepID=UPI003D1991DE